MKAFFLIKSPLQLLNALEARDAFKMEDSDCQLLLMADRKSREQLMKLVEFDQAWCNVVSLDSLPLLPSFCCEQKNVSFKKGSGLFSNDLFAIIKLRYLAKKCSGLEKIFLGDLGNPLMRHFANLFPKAEHVALDDGNATYKYAQMRCGDYSFVRDMSIGKKIKLFAKRWILGLKDAPLKVVTFFTAYNIKVGCKDRLVGHEFNKLRQGMSGIGYVDEIYFLGSPLVEAGILTEGELLQQLSLVKVKLADYKVRYIAHRRENTDRVMRIGREFDWGITHFDYPIEFQLAKIGPRPAQLASFFSSAIENCLTLFGETLPTTSFRLAPEYFSHKNTPRGEGINTLYDHYSTLQNNYFSVVQLGVAKD